MTAHSSFRVYPGGQLAGEIRVPGDKSISHRALMLGAIAQGVSEVSGFLDGEDCLATLAAMQAMGVQIEKPAATKVVIHGVGLHGLKAPTKPLYLGNSGTSIRLLAGLLSGQSFDVELSGDTSLSKRPMGRVIDPLQKMGAVIDSQPHQTAPLMIRAGAQLHGIRYVMPIASAQVKSCLLLAGLYAQGQTCVEEPAPTRDHTERMLQAMGCEVQRSGAQVCVAGSNTLSAVSFEVPADISSAAFFLVGASIAPGSDILLQHVGMNPTRTGVIDILRKMGADIVVCNERQISGEPVADLRVRAAPLTGIDIPEALVPLAIDEFPAIFIAAACAQGQTRLTGARELRVKESDRIQVMADGLAQLGIDAQPLEDGIVIQGGRLKGGSVASAGDHRIAMSFAIAGLRAQGEITIADCENVATSFPNFVSLSSQLGLNIKVIN